MQVVPVTRGQKQWPLHLAISDAQGNSAIIEFVDGKAVIHHGKEFTVMANEPPLGIQLQNLRKYKLFGGEKAMPTHMTHCSQETSRAGLPHVETEPIPSE